MLTNLLIVVLLTAWAAPAASGAKLRAGAFANIYNGLALPDTCVDLQESCNYDAVGGDCIVHPYEVRGRCPLSCRVQRCNARKGQQYHISGHATAAGTYEYSTRMTRLGLATKGHYRLAYTSIGPGDPDPATALMLSSLGMSTSVQDAEPSSLLSPEEPSVSAILHSLSHGWNVIDIMSVPGRDFGRAEAAVGEALTAALAGASFEAFPKRAYREFTSHQHPYPGDLTRDMVFVSTKAGYISSPDAQRLVDSGAIRPEDVLDVPGSSLADGWKVCVRAACLQHSLAASLERLQLRTVDVLYVDGIEEQLEQLGLQATMDSLRDAFKALEGMRKAQQIVFYGLATSGWFADSADQPQHLDLKHVVQLAKDVGGDKHGFRFIQVPLSPFKSQVWTEATQPLGEANVTLLDAAQKLRVQVFTTQPLDGDELVQWLGMRGALVAALNDVRGGGAKVVQWVRSTPGVLGTLVAQSVRGHVESNVRLAKVKALDQGTHSMVYGQLQELKS